MLMDTIYTMNGFNWAMEPMDIDMLMDTRYTMNGFDWLMEPMEHRYAHGH